ncbi:condensation domain-containing protein, partial [Mycobacterium marinum]|uniref:condensation domain-containing protein n=2 Tax=Mycobacterium marinum TaxID=1781 RepID=UPI001AA0950B
MHEVVMLVDRVRASSAQEALWFAQKLVPDLPNNVSICFEVSGPIDHDMMAVALRHHGREAHTLRVRFLEDQDGLHQVLCGPESWEPEFFDVSDAPDPDAAAQSIILEIRGTSFDLSHGLLGRAGLIKLNELRHFVFLVVHHIVCDGFSTLIAVRRVAEIYTALKSGSSIPRSAYCSPEAVAEYDSRYKLSERYTSDKEFWTSYTRAWPEPLNAIRRPTAPRAATLRYSTILTGEVPGRLHAAADGAGTLLPVFFIAAVAGCLSRLSSTSEFSVRLAVANRFGIARKTPCLLSNTVPVRVNVPSGVGFSNFASVLGREISSVLRHSRYPVTEIRDIGRLQMQRSQFGPVINVLPFFSETHELPDSHGAFRDGSFGACDDLLISIYYDARELNNGEPGSVYIQIDGNGLLYANEDLIRLADHLVSFLRAVSAEPQRRVDLVEIIDPVERQRLLVECNDTATAIPEATIPELFGAQVARVPESAAVHDDLEMLTYRELDVRASDLARGLAARGAGPEVIVAVALP